MIYCEIAPTTVPLWFACSADDSAGSPKARGNDADKGSHCVRVLIVEDEFFISMHTEALLHELGHQVTGVAVSADQAIEMADQERPDVVLMDIRLAGPRDGIYAAEEIVKRTGIAIIFVSANTDPQTRRRADSTQPIAFLEKPLSQSRLQQALSKLAKD